MRLPLLPALPVPPLPFKPPGQLPVFLLKPLTRTPFFLQALLLEKILAGVFREAIAEGDFDFLKNKYLKLEIRDLDRCWFFSFNGQGLTVHRLAKAHASISGELQAFLLLAARREDPDTLFFQRRLQIDGDTELGLEVKNILDTIELDALPTVLRQGLSLVR